MYRRELVETTLRLVNGTILELDNVSTTHMDHVFPIFQKKDTNVGL